MESGFKVARLDFAKSIPPNTWTAVDSLSGLDRTRDFKHLLHIKQTYQKSLFDISFVAIRFFFCSLLHMLMFFSLLYAFVCIPIYFCVTSTVVHHACNFWFPELLSPAFGKPSLFGVCSCISFISSVLFGSLLYCNSFYFIPGIYFVSSIKVNSFAGKVLCTCEVVRYTFRSGPSPLQSVLP